MRPSCECQVPRRMLPPGVAEKPAAGGFESCCVEPLQHGLGPSELAPAFTFGRFAIQWWHRSTKIQRNATLELV